MAKENSLEQRVERIERVLVSLAHILHGGGVGAFNYRYRRPGAEVTIYNRNKRASPFDPIAELFED